MPRAIVYSRFSPRPNADECESIEVQSDRCRAYCRARAYKIVGEFTDRALSGGRADNRPGLQAALEAACNLKAVLVVYKLDRLARNAEDALAIVRRLKEARGGLASVSEELNTNGWMGKFIFTMLAAIAEMYRGQIAERTSDAMLFHQATGRRMTRPDRCPFGKMPDPSDPCRLIEHPAEAAVIQRIRQQRHAGRGFREIARNLDEAGVDCRGHRWHDSAVRSILRRAGQAVEAL